ncbi:MAG: heavy-metal-associated domain-containing protein [Thermodesulfobacteriota bacterium]
MKKFALFTAFFIILFSIAIPAVAANVTLKVGGMTCRMCEGVVKKSLETSMGVTSAKVSYKEGGAVVNYNEKVTRPQELLKALEKAGYSGAVVEKK